MLKLNETKENSIKSRGWSIDYTVDTILFKKIGSKTRMNGTAEIVENPLVNGYTVLGTIYLPEKNSNHNIWFKHYNSDKKTLRVLDRLIFGRFENYLEGNGGRKTMGNHFFRKYSSN
ncbi:MAG: hypothetical protein KAK00_06490 [Nanoarchaeota archaeon]|nr:hypothetical protein [Nanoarchaeota archaeon]